MNSVEEALKVILGTNFTLQVILARRNILVVGVGRIIGQAVRLKNVRGAIRVFISGIAHFAATDAIRKINL